jgi:hypothetical protein
MRRIAYPVSTGRGAYRGLINEACETRGRFGTWPGFASWLAAAAIIVLTQLGYAASANAQANISLGGAGVVGAAATNTSWSLAKNGGLANGVVSWTVGATKVSISDQLIEVDGSFVINNSGTAGAYLGNIIVNLQRPCGTAWVSAAVDVADGTFGQAATFGNFISTASREQATLNSPSSICEGPGNYVLTAVNGQTVKEGTLFTGPGSGTANFFNASDNSVFSLVPEFKLHAGTSKRLYYTATFDNTLLGIAAGTDLRSEVLVSVSNAGPADLNAMQYVDVDDDDGPAGQGVSLDGDDSGWQQTAANRQIFVPTSAACNQLVTLTDTQNLSNPVLTGTATLTSFTSFNSNGTISIDGSSMSNGETNNQDVSAGVDGGASGGTITNCAALSGPNTSVTLTIGAFSKVFDVCTGANDTACDEENVPSSAGPASPTPSPTDTATPTPEITPTPIDTPTPDVTPTPDDTPTPAGTPTPVITPTPVTTPTPSATPTPIIPPFVTGEFCTYSEAHWSHTCGNDHNNPGNGATQSLGRPASNGCSGEGNQAFKILTENFSTVYNTDSGVQVGLPCSNNNFDMTFTSPSAVQGYLPAGGKPQVLNACLNNPSSSHSGSLGGEDLALELNVDFSAAGITEGSGGAFGSLNLCGSGTSLDGMSIAQILAAANKALGNGGMPAGLNAVSLRNLLHQLNESFDSCRPHGFAQRHLTGTTCP